MMPPEPDVAEVREFPRARSRPRNGSAGPHGFAHGANETAPAPVLRWHGDTAPEAPRWLVRDTLPETGVAILAGQSGVAKTFVAIDLAGSIMTMRDFAGQAVERRGGVLFLPAEGESEVDARLSAHVGDKISAELDELPAGVDPHRLPFARQAEGVPSLTADDAEARLVALAQAAQDGLDERHDGLPLAMIVVDTLAAAAGFKDENAASEAQAVMNRLRAVSRRTGALVLVVDHFGKLAETGVRGSSAKHAAADAVLAILAERDQAGTISNRRLVKHKVRAAATGGETPFAIRSVRLDEDGNTSCVVDWSATTATSSQAASPADPWRGKARILKRALDVVLSSEGQALRPFGVEGPVVVAATRKGVRAEFDRAYPADEDAKPDTKRRTFSRLVEDAVAKGILGARSISAEDWLWLAAK